MQLGDTGRFLTLEEMEKEAIYDRLFFYEGDRHRAAASLGISYGGLNIKMARHGMTKPREKKNRKGATIEGWIEEIRKLDVKSTSEWRQKDLSSYNYMSRKGLITMIATAIGLEMPKAGRPVKVKLETKTEGDKL
jgi:hypothetical protein